MFLYQINIYLHLLNMYLELLKKYLLKLIIFFCEDVDKNSGLLFNITIIQ